MSNPSLAARLAAVQDISELQAIAAEFRIELDASELDDQELSVDELSHASGGVGLLLASRLGLPSLSAKGSDSTDGCPTWDLDKCTVSTKKGESPSCG